MGAIAIGMFIMGWGVHKKKWYFLISGYNLMSKEDQAKVDEEGLGKTVGYMSYIIGVLVLAMGLFIHYTMVKYIWIIVILMVIVSIGTVIYSQRFYPKGVGFNGVLTPKSKKLTSIITVVSLVFVGVVIYFSIQPTKFTVTNEMFSISGGYGEDMKWEDITNLTLENELPEIALRTNGSAVGSKLKGNFKLESGEQVKLFVDKSVKAFIAIEWNGKRYFLNKPTVEETEQLYEEMSVKWK